MSDHIPDATKMINDTPRTDAEAFYPHDSKWKVCDAEFARQLERELNSTNAEIQSLKHNYERVIGMYTAKDNQICNLLHICRDNDIEVSSYDLIHRKEAKP
jgi:hypothetical protein